MANLENRIKSKIASFFFYRLMLGLTRCSNARLVKLTYLAEKIMTRDDPIMQRILSELRRYFKENHPALELIRRLIRNLNPKSKKMLIKNFLVDAVFKESSRSREYADREGFMPPWFIVLSPTMRCNLNCLGCSTRRYTKDDDLPIPVIDRILQEARGMGIHFIVTQGGEMFVYEEMLDLYKKHKDIYFQVYTNGTLIDKKMAKTLSSLGNVAPMISIEGFQESTDCRRGRGVFNLAMQAMDNLSEAGCLYGASVTQTSRNTEEVTSDAFFELLVKKGCYVCWFFQFLPIGKDPDLSLMATPQQRGQLRQKINEMRGKSPIFLADFWNDGPFMGGCIAAGRRFLHINNKGDVEPCAFAHFSVDNIKNKSLKEALNSPFFKFLRSRQPYGNGNLLAPCMIIDNPHILREAVAQTGARPTHEGAEVLLEGPVKEGLARYAAEIHRLTQPAWETIKDSTVKWPD